MHAGWNFLAKRRRPTAAFFLAANIIATACLLPALIYYRAKIPAVPASVWAMAGITGAMLAMYYASLAGAYRTGDLSIAYPLTRSLSVIMVALVSLALGKGHQISCQCMFGIALVVAGCGMLPVKAFRRWRVRDYLSAVCMLAALAAVGSAGYSMVDDAALRRLRLPTGPAMTPAESTIVYLTLEGVSASLWLGCYVALSGRERRSLRQLTRTARRDAALTGVIIYLTYALVLGSMAFVKNVSYVVAFRQISIAVGAILGLVLLREPRYLPKLLGVALTFAGLILVAAG